MNSMKFTIFDRLKDCIFHRNSFDIHYIMFSMNTCVCSSFILVYDFPTDLNKYISLAFREMINHTENNVCYIPNNSSPRWDWILKIKRKKLFEILHLKFRKILNLLFFHTNNYSNFFFNWTLTNFCSTLFAWSKAEFFLA